MLVKPEKIQEDQRNNRFKFSKLKEKRSFKVTSLAIVPQETFSTETIVKIFHVIRDAGSSIFAWMGSTWRLE